MKPIEEGLLDRIDAYIEQLFAPSDKVLTQNLEAARAAGLPPINVSATESKLSRLESLVIPLIREKIDGLSLSIVKER